MACSRMLPDIVEEFNQLKKEVEKLKNK